VTITTPLIVQEVLDEANEPMGWAVEGRPADCVKLGLRELLAEPPDLVVSGLNAGSNAGINVLYSGTVAAAIEGAFFRITSIACSLEVTRARPADFDTASARARAVIEQIVARRPPAGSLFNINIPDPERGPLRGVRVVPQNVAAYEEAYDRRRDPRGRLYFWAGASYHCPEPLPDSDVTALSEGWITVTPLQFNLTQTGLLRDMGGWSWPL
jgi:5'-nucleotidase